MFVLKNHCAPELSEVNSYARLNHSKQLLQNILGMMSASFLFTDKNNNSGCIKKPTE